ncbi:hypothetical protein ACNOYE_37710 [Nannocystaceae bacterium ST9]
MFGCKPEEGTDDPELSNEESLIGARQDYDNGVDEQTALDEQYGARSELPPMAEPTEKCTGKGKSKECKIVDPKPEVTAAYGARKLIGRFRWNMDPKTVMSQLEKEIEEEYAELQAKTKDPLEQDRNREWKRAQVDELARNRVKFEKAAHHRWAVSLIAHEFKDDEGEEMIWLKTPTLKKFYFFKDGELYKIVYAYGTQAWPGEDFKTIVETKFKKWFGISPEDKVKIDPETNAPLVRWVQWNSADGDRIRAFDMTAVHGALVLSVTSGEAEEKYGERLPETQDSDNFSQSVDDVLGGSDICYDEEGNMIEDAEKCAKINGAQL